MTEEERAAWQFCGKLTEAVAEATGYTGTKDPPQLVAHCAAILAELRAAREEIGKLRVDLTELEMWRAIQCATIRLADAVPGDGATEET